MMVVCKDRLETLSLATKSNAEASAKARDVNAAVESEINALLRGKTYDQLVLLQKQVQSKLASDERVDVDYWEGLLKSLLVWKARVSLQVLCSLSNDAYWFAWRNFRQL